MKSPSIAILLLIVCATSFGQIAVIKNADKITAIKNQVSFIEDKNNSLKINDVIDSKNFKAVEQDIPNFGVSSFTYWLKLEIENTTSTEDFLLQVSQPGLDLVQLFYTNKTGAIDSNISGEFLPFNERQIFDPNYIFRIELPESKTTTLFLKVKARDNIQVPIIIGTAENIFQINKERDSMAGLYVGIMLVMFFYNAFLFITIRDKSYLAYIVYLAMVILTQASIQGYTFQYLWPGLPLLASYSSFIFPPLVGIAGLCFLKYFLNTNLYFSVYNKGAIILSAGYLIAMLVAFAGYFKISFQMIEICAIGVSFYMLYVAYQIYKKGYRPAQFFLIAWSVFLLGVSIYVMKDMSILPFNNFTNYTMPIGSAIEVVLLSFALADRINTLKKEKDESQAEMLIALKENEKLITQQNIILETKVHERTQELENKNDELQVTLTHLKNTQAQLVDAEKMASLGQLTAGIAHEINNPINFVSANVKPLQMDIDDLLMLLNRYESIKPDLQLETQLDEIEKLKKEIDFDYLKTEINTLITGIEDGANRTAEIVKGLKNFSRLDESEIKYADLNEGLESTIALLKSTIPANVEVIKKLQKLPEIECYPGKMNQVFMNVLNNAIQAMEKKSTEGKHQLIISSSLKDENVIISIEDTGVGMTEEVKAKVFEPFFTTKDVGKGTGLGMSIVYKIIENHNGKIEIQSVPAVGTKVILTLPINLKSLLKPD